MSDTCERSDDRTDTGAVRQSRCDHFGSGAVYALAEPPSVVVMALGSRGREHRWRGIRFSEKRIGD